jgi:hypothetical protein
MPQQTCLHCGLINDINQNTNTCGRCGATLGVRPLQQHAMVPVQAPVPVYIQAPAPIPPSNGFAVAGLIFGILPVPILGWIFGGIGMARARTHGGGGMATAGVILATVWFFLILAAQSQQ